MDKNAPSRLFSGLRGGKFVRFDVDEVRAALAENATVRARVPQRPGFRRHALSLSKRPALNR